MESPTRHQLTIRLSGREDGAAMSMYGQVDARTSILVEEMLRDHLDGSSRVEVELWDVPTMEVDALRNLIRLLVDGPVLSGDARLVLHVRTRRGADPSNP